MIKKIGYELNKHSALLMMLSASLASLITNILAKTNFTPDVYSWFVLYFIFVGYLGTLSFIGSDNVLLRFCEIFKEKMVITGHLVIQLFFSWVSAGLLLIIIGFMIMGQGGYGVVEFLIPFIAMSLIVIISLFFRLTGNFLIAQLTIQIWKFVFLGVLVSGVLIGIVFDIKSISNALIFSLIVASMVSITCLKYEKTALEITRSKGNVFEYLHMQFGYLISLVFFAILGTLDRVILQGNLTALEFSEYAYLVVLLLYPINLISSYIGYKELIEIKKGKSIFLIHISIKLIVNAVIMYSFYTLLLFLVAEYIDLKFDLYIWVASLVIVIAKMPYAIFSAIIGARCSSKDMSYMNAACILVLFGVYFIVYLYPDKYIAIFSMSFIWVFRSLFYYFTARNYALGVMVAEDADKSYVYPDMSVKKNEERR